MQRSILFRNIKGSLEIPGSKSASQRAVACALLAQGESVLTNATSCDDLEAALRAAASLGARIKREGDTIHITGGLRAESLRLDCGEAGLSIRMFSPIASLLSEEIVLEAHGSLLKRPLSMIRTPLESLGVSVILDGRVINDGPPVRVKGPLLGGRAEIDGSVSSQFLTGLLIALTQGKNESVLDVKNLKSRPYVDMTIEMLSNFGAEISNNEYSTFIVRPQPLRSSEVLIEGDWSSASFIICAAAVAGEVRLKNLRAGSLQADRAVLDAAVSAGADVSWDGADLLVSKNKLKAFTFDATDCPDLFPPLASLAARCEGTSVIKGATRLKHKESDRASALREELAKAGIRVDVEDDVMRVHGGNPRACTMDSRGDHRIAMCSAQLFAGLEEKVSIAGSESVAKSYPSFFNDISSLGAEVSVE